VLFCFAELGFELRASCLQGRPSTTWLTPPALCIIFCNLVSHKYGDQQLWNYYACIIIVLLGISVSNPVTWHTILFCEWPVWWSGTSLCQAPCVGLWIPERFLESRNDEVPTTTSHIWESLHCVTHSNEEFHPKVLVFCFFLVFRQ
jgi:hypothetical protein